MEIDYKSAGVDVEAGYKAVSLIKKYIKQTYDGNVLGGIGDFGGLYALDDKPDGDVLVAGTDGVGTKLKYAFISDKHSTIGIDAVAMCVNDIVCHGARPLFFLDYIAIPKLIPHKVAEIVKGVSIGCQQAGCVLLGGETAEMPNFYADGEYDIAGFCCGITQKNKIIDGKNIQEGNVLIGLASSGLHSNGFTLVRRLFGENYEELNKHNNELDARLIDILLTPTKIYAKTILSLITHTKINGIAHITGGGFIENIPRILPKGLGAQINTNSYTVPKIFRMLQDRANLSDIKAYNTFNMGIGMVLAVDKSDVDNVMAQLKSLREEAYIIGSITKGDKIVCEDLD